MSAVATPKAAHPTPPVGMAVPGQRARRARLRLTPGLLGTGTVMLVTGFLVLYPIGMLVYGSFRTSRPGLPGTFTLDNYISAYTSLETYQLFATTVLLMGAKTLVAAVIALVLAWIVARTDTPFRGTLEVLIITPYFVPGILETIGWIMLLSPRSGVINVFASQVLGLPGPLFNIYSLGGMIWVMSLGSVSFMFLFIVSALRSMDAAMEEAARTSGSGTLRTALTVTLPLIAPAIFGAVMLSFIRALDSFEIPVLLGTPAGIQVFANRIYAAVTTDYPINYGLATALGVTFALLTLGAVLLQQRVLKGKEFSVVSGKGYQPRLVRLGWLRWVAFAICVGYFLVATVLPLSQIVLGSFSRVFGMVQPDMFTLSNYTAVLTDVRLWRGLTNTLMVGGGAAVATMLLSAVIAYVVTRTRYPGRRLLDLVAWLPWTIPGVVAGLGMLWAYISLPLPIRLYGTTTLLVIVFITVGLPLGVRLMAGGLMQLGPELEEGARVHGAGWLYTFRRVVLPLVKPAMAAAVLMLFVSFSRSVSSVVLFAGQGTELLAVLLFQYTLNGQMEVVAALAIVLLVINVAALVLARRLGAFGIGQVH